MPYVQRNVTGDIIGLFANPQDGSTEFISDDNTEVVALNTAWARGATEQQRRSAYQFRSDPLFFKWQRGEATQQEWADEIAAIKAEFPKS